MSIKKLGADGVKEVWNKVFTLIKSVTGDVDVSKNGTLQAQINKKADNVKATAKQDGVMSKEYAAKLDEISNKIELSGTLTAGNTSLTFSDSRLTNAMMIEGVYTDVYGISPTDITFSSGTITITFDAQDTDITVKVVCR